MSKKANYGKWRAISLSAVYLLIGFHIAHWQIAGKTLAPLEFNEVLYTIHRGIITAGFLFMGVTMVGTLIFGRFFCSWMCHVLALQDGSAWILNKLNIKPKHIRSRFFYIIPLLAVIYLFVVPQFERFFAGSPAAELKVLTDKEGWASFTTTDFWRNLPGIGITLFTFFVSGFLVVYFLGSRSFCQYGCPYGVLFAAADKIAPGKITLAGNCNQCGLCTAACNSHILVHKEIDKFGKVVDSNCLKDLDCIQACPENALKFGFTKPAFGKSLGKTNQREFDFTVREDIFLGVSALVYMIIFRGLYDSVPFLLAIGISIILSLCTVYALRMFKQEFVRVNQFVLKHSNKLTTQGKWYLTFFSLVLVLTIHSGFVHYHSYTGDKVYHEILLSQNSSNINVLSPLLSKAQYHLEAAYNYGIYSPASLNRQLASLYLTTGRIKEAKEQLKKMLDALPEDYEAHLRYAKILISENNDLLALQHLQLILGNSRGETKNDAIIRSNSALMVGQLKEQEKNIAAAIALFRKALIENTDNADAMLALGIASIRFGNFDEGEKNLLKAEKYFKSSYSLQNSLSVLYLRTKKYNKALIHMMKMLEISPNDIEVQYNIAMANFALGEKEKSIAMLKHILTQYPEHRNSLMALDLILKNKLNL
jgi:tetratricopeptide (TPR) repeat protein/NAD-dependent dihydropyrimidine dehydrogenase PreA subunit